MMAEYVRSLTSRGLQEPFPVVVDVSSDDERGSLEESHVE